MEAVALSGASITVSCFSLSSFCCRKLSKTINIFDFASKSSKQQQKTPDTLNNTEVVTLPASGVPPAAVCTVPMVTVPAFALDFKYNVFFFRLFEIKTNDFAGFLGPPGPPPGALGP